MTNNLHAIAAEVAEHPAVYSAKVWNDRRVYVNLVGADRGFAGDRNLKVFFDAKLGWVFEEGRGIRTSALNASLDQFRAHIA